MNYQLTTAASDAIHGKLLFEQEVADEGISIKGYDSDNIVFSSVKFWSHCCDLGQYL